MANIDKAREAKTENTLNKNIRVNGQVKTVKQWIQETLENGGRIEEKEVPSVQYNRVKFNRMTQRQQDEYEKKLNTLKPEFRLFSNDNTFCVLNKTEYEYAKQFNL